MIWEYTTRREGPLKDHQKTLASLGAEGWELVAAIPINNSVNAVLDQGSGEIAGGSTEFILFIFKRPRPADAG